MFIAYILIALCGTTPVAHATSYITYGFSGRLGDMLSSYMHTQWIAYKYGLLLVYKPFEFSDKLKLSDMGVPFDALPTDLPKQVLEAVPPMGGFQENVIYEAPYGTECVKTLRKEIIFPLLCPPDWHDPIFMKLAREAIAPKSDVLSSTVQPPRNKVAIALHIRLGGGHDISGADMYARAILKRPYAECNDIILPGNMPPHIYYISCLRSIIAMFPQGTKFYVHLFTDHHRPLDVAQAYWSDFQQTDIEWSYRDYNPAPGHNALEDFFSLMNFHVLIMSASNYSWVASKIGNFAIVAQPGHLVRVGGLDIIDKVKWYVQGQTYETAVEETPPCRFS